MRSEYKLEPARKLHAVFVSVERQILLESQMLVLCDLAGLDPEVTEIRAEKPADRPVWQGWWWMRLRCSCNWQTPRMTAENERLRKELAELESQITRLENLLTSPFAQGA